MIGILKKNNQEIQKKDPGAIQVLVKNLVIPVTSDNIKIGKKGTIMFLTYFSYRKK